MVTIANTPLRPDEVGSPLAWLYVSKRLDLDWLPNTPFWSGEVITFGATAFYRLTSQVLVWLEAAGDVLESHYRAGQVDHGQLVEYVNAMEVVWLFARSHLQRDSVVAARLQPPSLPDSPQPK